MSDEIPPVPPAPEPAPSEDITRRPDRVQLLRDKQQPRPPEKQGPVPSLQKDMSYGSGRKVDAFDADMERELQEAMTGFAGKDLLGGQPGDNRRGKVEPGPKKGRVFRIHGPNVFVELPGGRTQGVILLAMFPEGAPAIGSEIEVVIDGVDPDGLLRLSRQGAAVQANWSTLAVGQIVEARVTDTNTGGLTVDVDGIRGFLPISQIDLYRVEDTKQFLGQKLLCLITEADKADNNLVLSRRALLEKQREDQRDQTWARLEVGQVYDGIVRSIKDFGAFVDIGGVDGLVHVSDMSWERKQNAADLVKVGLKVKVEVLRIDPEKRKVSLGMKQLTASPWDEVPIKYPIGSTVPGKVTRTTEFGAFVELEPAIEGLIHISELATQRVRRVTDIVKVDQPVEVVVLAVDREQRRISLSLKAALKKAEAVVEEDEEDTEPEVPAKPQRPRTIPLRGGNTDKGPFIPPK
jgi:ribosomal protein S1